MKKEKIYTDDEVRLQETNTDSLEKEIQDNIDYCPGCNVAYCHGRYTTGQCE